MAARAFGERLGDHVRFEERELFPACEATLSDDVLDEVARRVPREA
jgi:hemerythrin-like domain-containing protein